MKIKIRYSLIAVSVLSLLVGGVALAQSSERLPLQDSHKEKIVANCESAKLSLRQLHRSDASLRVSRGQTYEHIGSKLMARLNSRLALNQLDAGQMIEIAARFDQQLAGFRSNYKVYEENLSAILGVNCQRNPEDFYYRVVQSRQDRQAVHASVTSLNAIVEEYYQEFGRFAEGYGLQTEEQVSNE